MKVLQPLPALTTCFLSSRHLVPTCVIIHVVFYIAKTTKIECSARQPEVDLRMHVEGQ